jgi:hypothetical protein
VLLLQSGEELLQRIGTSGQELANSRRGLQGLGKFTPASLLFRQRPVLRSFFLQAQLRLLDGAMAQLAHHLKGSPRLARLQQGPYLRQAQAGQFLAQTERRAIRGTHLLRRDQIVPRGGGVLVL